MHLTKESDYALRGLALLAMQPSGEVRSLSHIAAAQGLPSPFLAKIFQRLTRQGILVASRGPGAGYALARAPGSISLREILECVEGPRVFEHCLLFSEHNHANPCALHQHLVGDLTPLIARLGAVTLEHYAATRGVGDSSSIQGKAKGLRAGHAAAQSARRGR